jgi:hypothetical protein
MVKFLQSSLLKIAMAAMALLPVGVCFTAETVSAAETAQAYTIKPKANSKGIVHSISPIIVTFDNATTIVPNTSVPQLTYGYVEYNAGDEGWIEVLSGEQIFGNSIHYFVIDSAVKPGEFKLTIPAGTYLVDGVPNEEIVHNFTYEEGVQIEPVITPAEGEVESLQEFTIEFQGATDLATAFSREAYPVLYNVTGDHNEFSWTSGSVDGNKLTLKTNAPIIYVGNYELRIPGASYTVEGDQGDDLVFKYTIVPSAKTIEYEITPVAGEDGNVSAVSPITVKFPNALSVADNPNADYWTQYAYVEYNSQRAGWGEIPADIQLQGNTILVFLEDGDQISGEFKLTIPAGTYLVDGKANEDIVATFNYVLPLQDYARVLPEEGEVEGLQNFTVEFPRYSSVATNFSRDAAPVLYNVTGEHSEYTWTSATTEGNKLILNTKAELAIAGDYELRIPGAAYTVDGTEGRDLVYKYTVVTSAKTVEYTITPVADEEGNVDAISPIVVTFPNAAAVVDNPNADYYTQYAYVEYNSPRAGWGEIPAEIQVQNNTVAFFLEEGDQIPGEFRLTIPAGTYLADGRANEEIVATFVVAEPEQDYAVIYPAEGEVEGLQAFTIEFPAATELTYTITREAYPELYNVTADRREAAITSAKVEGNRVSFSLNAPITVAGEYELRVPGAAYTVDGEQGRDLVFKYTIVASEKTFEYTINPEDGETITSFSSVVIKFPNAASVSVDDSDEYPYIESYSTSWNDWGELDTNVETVGNEIVLTVPSYVTLTSGDYHVIIPAGIVTVDGAVLNDEIFSKFTLEQAVPEFATIIDPLEGTVASLGAFNIVFDGIDTVTLDNYSNDTKFYIETEEGIKIYSTDSYIDYDAEGNPVHIEFNKITTEGKYTLVLPANSYKVNGVYGNELRFEYTISATDAISSIFVDGVDSVDVYDLRGVRVLSNAKAQDLRSLNTNVYIINGQKYLIRK